MVEMHEDMQSCCEHQQCCAHTHTHTIRVTALHVSRISSEMQHRDRQREIREARLHFKSSMECAEGGDPAAGDWFFTCCHQKWEHTHNTGLCKAFSPSKTYPLTRKKNITLHSSYTHTHTQEKHHSRWQSCPIICLLKMSFNDHLSEGKTGWCRWHRGTQFSHCITQ